ncbi:MAG TPA: glycosyltransferase family 1 protein [Ignavibacteria bacterium]|nr:glycosyltransferase family 1 protein [Ignavibacteria bacterium]
MRIGMVLDKRFPPDARVENEAVTLVKNNHEVFLLCYDFRNSLPKIEIYKGIKILRIAKTKKWANRGRGLINTPFDYYSRFWELNISYYVKENTIDVLHIHDLYLLGAGLKSQQKSKIPIIADLHENYVEGLKHYKFANTFPGKYIISIPKWEKREIEWCQSADHIITVIDEAANRYQNLGIQNNKIHVVANYVNINEVLSFPIDPSIKNNYRKYFVITYVGGFDTHRGLESIIRAIPLIVDYCKNLKLVLVGYGRNYTDLTKLVKSINVQQYVDFIGYQPAKNLPSYISASDICLIPHLKTIHTDNTIPHKLFHYMLFQKPVVASNCNPIERIIKETNCGKIYPSMNSVEFAKSIHALFADPELRSTLGRNGKIAVYKKYNWEQTSKTLLKLYNKINLNDK